MLSLLLESSEQFCSLCSETGASGHTRFTFWVNSTKEQLLTSIFKLYKILNKQVLKMIFFWYNRPRHPPLWYSKNQHCEQKQDHYFCVGWQQWFLHFIGGKFTGRAFADGCIKTTEVIRLRDTALQLPSDKSFDKQKKPLLFAWEGFFFATDHSKFLRPPRLLPTRKEAAGSSGCNSELDTKEESNIVTYHFPWSAAH